MSGAIHSWVLAVPERATGTMVVVRLVVVWTAKVTTMPRVIVALLMGISVWTGIIIHMSVIKTFER